jgi:hypothetical protein
MTHREIAELRRLGDSLLALVGTDSNRLLWTLQALEKTAGILSGPIITAPVFPRSGDQSRGVFEGNPVSCEMADVVREAEVSVGAMDALGITTEAIRVASRLGRFEWKTSHVWAEIKDHFGRSISLADLKDLTKYLGEDAGLAPDRDAKRRKSVLVKWLDENWSHLSPFLANYRFDPDNKSIIRAHTY